MENKSLTSTIEVEKSPQDVFNCIKDVSKWWGGKDLEGNFYEFAIHHPNAHFSKQKLIELVPDKKIVGTLQKAHFTGLKKIKMSGQISN